MPTLYGANSRELRGGFLWPFVASFSSRCLFATGRANSATWGFPAIAADGNGACFLDKRDEQEADKDDQLHIPLLLEPRRRRRGRCTASCHWQLTLIHIQPAVRKFVIKCLSPIPTICGDT